jgi:hypothetical protein
MIHRESNFPQILPGEAFLRYQKHKIHPRHNASLKIEQTLI